MHRILLEAGNIASKKGNSVTADQGLRSYLVSLSHMYSVNKEFKMIPQGACLGLESAV